MTDLRTKPRSGQLLDPEVYGRYIDRYLNAGYRIHESYGDFCSARGTRLANHERAHVSLMRVPYAPYYDTKFVLKYFRTQRSSLAPNELAELEAASLHHAAEAFQRNNIGRAPRVYAVRTEEDLIAMEWIRGKGYRDSSPEWWPKERMIKFVRQMAVVRLAILTQAENQLGVPRHNPDGRRVGPFCSHVWWDNERYRLWGRIDRGPFPNRHELILASLLRDLLATRWMRDNSRPIPRRSHFYQWNDLIAYLEMTIDNIEEVPRPTQPEFFSLSHNDLGAGFNIMLRGGKLVAVIDWETASYDPLAMCVVDLTTEIDFNPRVWREHAGPDGENFHVLPYRLEADPIEGRMAYATSVGAEQRPFPDWELIENNGGPLCEEDFCGGDYPEDLGSDDDESILDAAEVHCDSDAEAEEECVLPETGGGAWRLDELVRRGIDAPNLANDWYYEPVYSLMKEFIHHHRGTGLGPNGEWGRVPEQYSRPLAEWDDPLFWRVTQTHFEGRHSQVIDEERVVATAAKAPPVQKAYKTGKIKEALRLRRVPTLLNAWRDAAATGAEIPPESPAASGAGSYANWTRSIIVHPSPGTTARSDRAKSICLTPNDENLPLPSPFSVPVPHDAPPLFPHVPPTLHVIDGVNDHVPVYIPPTEE
ncbi:hypothetical protein C7212DRAFT_342202 [Tuber magnatum]|uniref:Aminoglycoside phosphotransferase domain-containing protein n=1 Tax=Tuber magnatum TaxID=42249 RepID=A0A317SVX4_9PEZI|nr:hypothetical protein C7212DRAFT_342202 [Tuber magnatum]